MAKQINTKQYPAENDKGRCKGAGEDWAVPEFLIRAWEANGHKVR